MDDVILKLTERGEILHAKIQEGRGTIPLEITRIVSGADISPEPLKLTSLVDPRLEFDVLGTHTDGPMTTFSTSITNFGNQEKGIPPLTEGYLLSQVGFYAIDPDIGEILYRISQYQTPLNVPSFNIRGWSYRPTFNIVTGNASTIIIEISPAGELLIQDVWRTVEFSDFGASNRGVRLHYRNESVVSEYEPLDEEGRFAGANITEMRIVVEPNNPDSAFRVMLPMTVLSAVIDPVTGDSIDVLLEKHADSSVVSENGMHGLRYHDSRQEIFDPIKGEWVRAWGGPASIRDSFTVEDGVLSSRADFGTEISLGETKTLLIFDGFGFIYRNVLHLI